jgi:3-phenylpropionate/cinnamic acid dioxygenase small subunit
MSDLDQLLDKQAITETCYRYGIALDSRDWATLRTCFTEDATAIYRGLEPANSYREIEDRCRAVLEPLTGSQHLISNVMVRLDGDQAECTSYLQAQHVKAGTPGGDNYIIAGRYDDRLVRTPAGWRMTERRLEIIWTDGNPAVVGG